MAGFRRALLAVALSLGLGGCVGLGLFAANLPAYFGHYKLAGNIAYGADPQQRLDVYTPDGVRAGAPVIVFWHGGRWSYGDKRQYRFVAAALCELGYVAVLPNYRHYPQVKLAGFMQDAALAAAWASDHAKVYGADPGKLYLMGHSAGAHLAALLALDQHYLAAAGKSAMPIAGVIGLSGPYDFLPLTEDDTRDMFGPPDAYPQSQPITFARAGAPPMLLFHGAADTTVWPKNSRNLAAALTLKGDSVRLLVLPNLEHADTVASLSIPARKRAPVLSEIAAFVGGGSAQAAGR